MSAFLDPLRVKLAGKDRWILETRFRFLDSTGRVTEVPAEFITDFASVPRLPFAYLIAGGRCPQAAVPHDFLYQHPDWDDRPGADRIFWEAAGVTQPECGIEAESDRIRRLMWVGIRAGGWKVWADHGKRSAILNPIWTATAWPEMVQAA